jgi:HNH endonuclease
MSAERVPASMQRRVRERAADRCEYCGIEQSTQEATFHIDHITPRVAGGTTSLDNLALACVSCSLRKGARQTAPDPLTAEVASLLHPRNDAWSTHLRVTEAGVVEGLTPTGRATVEALKMNRPLAIALRREATAATRRG